MGRHDHRCRGCCIVILACGAVLVPPQARGQVDHYHLWGVLSADALVWETASTQTQIIEGLVVGASGYIADPYVANFVLSTGIAGQHSNWRSEWVHGLGWSADGAVTLFPVSRFPLTLRGRHITRGLSPGGHPAANFSTVTEAGGQWMIALDGWPELRLFGSHTMLDLGLAASQAVPADVATDVELDQLATSRAGIAARRSSGRHESELQLELLQHVRDPGEERRRVATIRLSDFHAFGTNTRLASMVDAQIGEFTSGDLGDDQPFSDYRVRLELSRAGRQLRLVVSDSFWQSSYLDGELLGNELVAESFLVLVRGVDLFTGVAVSVLDERLLEDRQQLVREQLGAGVRVNRFVLGGDLGGKLLARVGGVHLIGVGDGAALSIDASGGWGWRLARRLRLRVSALAVAEQDWSPLGVGQAAYELRLAMLTAAPRGISGEIVGFFGHHRHEEVFPDEWTVPAGTDGADDTRDTYTEAGVRAGARYELGQWMQLRTSLAWAITLASTLGTQHTLDGEAQLLANPLRGLVVTLRGLGSLRTDAEEDFFGAVQTEASVGWRLRQLSIEVSYRFLLDDYRGVEEGEHLFVARIARRFDLRLGGTKR